MTSMAGTVAVGRHSAGTVAESFHSYTQVGDREKANCE